MPGLPGREKSFASAIVAVGVDLVDLDRIERLLDAEGDRFLARVFTAAEREYCMARARPVPSLAARFAAKEAVMKCLGTGFGEGVGFAQIEVVRSPRGEPSVALHGRAAAVAAERGIAGFRLSLSHGDRQAIAFAVALAAS
ncbi:MAG TPA: holo-ACP synthase [Planctomycetota bacterium]|nr:holo-ACP synthase [Planctomycetota bacterium]